MLTKNIRILCKIKWFYTLKICSAALLMTFCASCVTTVQKEEYPLNSRIMAENSSIKKRLPLIERENDVLRKENHQHRTNILALETKIKNLGLELAFLGEKYDNDMAMNEMQIKDLQLTIQEIEKESAERIKSLTSMKATLKRKLAREVHAHNKNIVAQKEAFEKEREQIMKANNKRESSLSGQIDALKKTINAKELESASLKKANIDISNKLGEASALAEALKKARDEASAELETVKATNTRLTKALNSQ